MNDVFKVFSPVEKFDIHAAVLDRRTRYNTYPSGAPEPSKIRSGIETEGKYPWRYTEHPCTLDTVVEDTTQLLQSFEELADIKDDVADLVKCAVFRPQVIDSLYRVYQIPKESGGFRTIEAPSKLLKRVQRVILEKVLYQSFRISNQAMGFVPHRSIKGNALRHCNFQQRLDNTGRWLWKMDLKDFFPSISANQALKGLIDTFNLMQDGSPLVRMKAITYRQPYNYVSYFMGIMYLCTYRERLPQGAPTSPFLSNLVYAKFDNQISGIVSTQGGRREIIYTRYADDVTISSTDKNKLFKIIPLVENLIEKKMGGIINRKKVAICCHGRPMRVTGININEGPSISRTKRDKVRMMLYHTVKQGWVGLHEKARLSGYRNFYRGVDRQGWDCRCEKDFQLMDKLPVREDAPLHQNKGEQ